MADALVRARAIRVVDDSFPGWIEVRVTDAAGRDHLIVDKVPIFTNEYLAPNSGFPTELWISVDTTEVNGNDVTVKLRDADTQGGLNELVIASGDVKWL